MPEYTQDQLNMLLCRAAASGDLEEMKRLVSLGADPNCNMPSEERQVELDKELEKQEA